jgi:hypothetical protein
MLTSYRTLKIYILTLLIFSAAFVSCELFDTSNDYKITLLINCTGGVSQVFTLNLIVDDYALSSDSDGQFEFPFDKIKSMTVTATKNDGAAALQINILKDNKVVRSAFLGGNYPTSGSPTNSITLLWALENDKTKGVPVTGG